MVHDENEPIVVQIEAERPKIPEPLSVELHRKFAELIPEYSFGLEIIGSDVVFGHIHNGNMMIQGYMLIVSARGALIGVEGQISHYEFLTCGLNPTRRECIQVLAGCMESLREAKAQQLSVKSHKRP
jgi:hypothetical protein